MGDLMTMNREVAGLNPSWDNIFPRIDDSYCNMTQFSSTAGHSLDNAYVCKQPVALAKYYAKHWCKKLQ